MYYLYIIKSLKHPKTYTGITDHVERRLKEHNSGYSQFAKRYKPWKMIHLEEFSDREKARKKEKYFKSAAGRRKIKNLLFNN
jgi:putative endonuclease